MDEEMTFVNKTKVLTFEEMQLIAEVFVELGVSKIRLTGGEPLIRANVMSLFESMGAIENLGEFVLSTNGSQLTKYASQLKTFGIKRINISLDSLRVSRFKSLTRIGDLNKVLQGIDTACATGFEKIKLNAVILKGRNDDEVLDLVNYAIDKKIDISFIEEMPLGVINEHNRGETFCSSDELKAMIEAEMNLVVSQKQAKQSDGPSNYFQVEGTQTHVGFISPHSHNFCSACNRVRVTAEGKLLLCLGNEHSADLRDVLRTYPGDRERLKQEIIRAMDLKPEKHEFKVDQAPEILRFMNMTGG